MTTKAVETRRLPHGLRAVLLGHDQIDRPPAKPASEDPAAARRRRIAAGAARFRRRSAAFT
jgi:hypothetical protein